MSIDRRLQCPSCAQEIRVTQAELADKRGFCAVCDARFDILPDMLIGEGPMRSLVVPRAALALEKAPDPRFSRVVSGTSTELVCRPSRAKGAILGLFAVLWVGFLVVWYGLAIGRGDLFALLFPLLHVLAGVAASAAAAWHLLGDERLQIGPTSLVYSRGVGALRQRKRLPAGRHMSVVVEDHRRLLRGKDGPQDETVVRLHGDDGEMILGRAFDLTPGQADWLARAVRKGLADSGEPR